MKLVGKCLLAGFIIAASLLVGITARAAQTAPTATPMQIEIATAVLTRDVPLETPVATDTPQGQIFIEARDFANVRAQPDTNSSQLGQIRSGELYLVIGRYFQWIQFEYRPSPTGRGWVFGDLVNIIGDASAIPEIVLSSQPTVNPQALQQTSTQNVLTQTPGGILTATAFTRIMGSNPNEIAPVGQGNMPTFTYPPGIIRATASPSAAATQTAVPAQTQSPAASESLPPIIPIIVLFAVGVLGLAMSTIRK